jgi:CBS domain-containing protein
MNLIRVAHVPPAAVELSASVADAVRAMVDNGVGAVAVVDLGILKGIFSERDLMKKVIYRSLSPDKTPVAEVMTAEVESIRAEMQPADALRLLVERHFRHLPIVDEHGKVQGILSIRNLLEHMVEELEDSVNSLTSYFAADGPGG